MGKLNGGFPAPEHADYTCAGEPGNHPASRRNFNVGDVRQYEERELLN